jgi:hypothetical protein
MRLRNIRVRGFRCVRDSGLIAVKVGHKVVVLYDNEPEAKKHAEELKKLEFPEEQITFVESAGKTECDIEDMFSETFFLNAVNDVYRVILKSSKYTAIQKADLLTFRQKNPSVTRIVPILEKIWESHEPEGWGGFDKVAVCEKICLDVLQNRKIEEAFATAFGQLFERIRKAGETSKPASLETTEIQSPQTPPCRRLGDFRIGKATKVAVFWRFSSAYGTQSMIT